MPRDTQRGLLRAFAKGIGYYREDIDSDISEVVCPYCEATTPALPGAYGLIPHQPTCLIARARGLLKNAAARKDTHGQE